MVALELFRSSCHVPDGNLGVASGLTVLSPQRRSSSSMLGANTLRPLMPQVSRGMTSVFRTCIPSLDQSRFAFFMDTNEQLNLMEIPASVSFGRT